MRVQGAEESPNNQHANGPQNKPGEPHKDTDNTHAKGEKSRQRQPPL